MRARDRRLDGDRVGDPVDGVLVGVDGETGRLRSGVDALDVGADRPRPDGRHALSSTSVRVRSLPASGDLEGVAGERLGRGELDRDRLG